MFFPMEFHLYTLWISAMRFNCDFLEVEIVKKRMSEKQLIAIHFQSIGKSLWRQEI